jgi:hypothetical protein
VLAAALLSAFCVLAEAALLSACWQKPHFFPRAGGSRTSFCVLVEAAEPPALAAFFSIRPCRGPHPATYNNYLKKSMFFLRQ